MDKAYKQDIPAARKALEKLKVEFSHLDSKTNWKALRVEPLLQHARSLERLLQSPRFAQEVARLPRGVAMFHSDLVYFRENVKALRAVLKLQTHSNMHASGTGQPRLAKLSPKRKGSVVRGRI